MRKLYSFLLTAFVLIITATNKISAQNYTFTTTAGNAIVPGVTLVPGSQADDATSSVAIPFPYTAYGTVYNSVNVGTNGNLQFTTTNTAFTNVCPLPAAAMGVSFFPHWDDLDMSAGGALGIYTSTTGVAPNRIFNIEWRALRFSGTNPVSFETRLFEGQQRVDYIYGAVDLNGASASIGVQSVPAALQTTFSCNTGGLSAGLGISFVINNDLCTGAVNINCGQTISGTTVGFNPDVVPFCGTTLTTAAGVWYSFVGDGANNTLSLCGSSYDTKIGVFSGTCAALVCVAGNDDNNACGLGSFQSQVVVPTVLGTTYYVLVTGFSTATGAFTLTRTCLPNCAGVPSPGFITGPSTTLCSGAAGTLTLNGYTTGVLGITFQWKQSATPGGPYANIPGATNTTVNINPINTTYYVCTVTCNFSGLSGTSSEFTVNVDHPIHTSITATPSTFCTPGPTAISATVANGFTTAGIAVIGTSGTINLAIPDATAAGVNSTITLAAVNIPNAGSLKVRINANHSWAGDLKFRLTSPCGVTFLFDQPGVPVSAFGNSDNLGTSNATTPPPAVYTFDIAGATVFPETSTAPGFVPAGVYKPSDVNGAAQNWAGITFPCAAAGTWTLNVSDNGGGDVGTLVDWQILGPSAGNYTHTLTGPGTITQNASTGPNNSTGNFSVTNLAAGVQNFAFTSTDLLGCSVTSNISVTVNQTPVGSLGGANNYVFTTSAGNAIVPGVTLVPGSQADDATSSVAIPFSYTAYGTGYNSVNVGTNGNLQFTTINTAFTNVCPLPAAAMGVSFFPHWDDLNMSAGGALGIYTSVSGVAPNRIFNIEWRARLFGGALPVNLEARLFEGQQRVDYIYGAVDLNGASASIGVQSVPVALQTTFSCNTASLSPGLGISFVIPPPTICSGQTTNLPLNSSVAGSTFTWTAAIQTAPPGGTITGFSNCAAACGTTIAQTLTNTGTDAGVVRYTVTPTSALGCTGAPFTIDVTVNALPNITVQPSPATQTICPGFTVTYTVTATGTGLTYQWRKGGVNLANGGFINGVTTNTLVLSFVSAATAGSYDVVVSGACPPSVTSNTVVLNVASAPTITTQPVNVTVCSGLNTSFSVVATGVPPPTIYQWQVSTDGGATWNNVAATVPGVFTPTLSLLNVTTGMSGNRYRVIITNSCGQTITSNSATLTVNPTPVVVATDLFNQRICLSDTLIPLVGTPVGGTWSGIGVSGFNFVPPATAIGKYLLTYTYTNSFGCTASDTTNAIVSDCPERIRELKNDAIVLYPNPNNGRFNIRIKSTLYNYLGMKVFDMTGRLVNGKISKNGLDQVLISPVFNGLVYGRVIPIDISYLPSGTYLVEFYYDDGIRTSKKGFLVMIQK